MRLLGLSQLIFDDCLNCPAHPSVHRIGVCGTGTHAFGGKQPFFTYPRIPGHELGVKAAAVGLIENGRINTDPLDHPSRRV